MRAPEARAVRFSFTAPGRSAARKHGKGGSPCQRGDPRTRPASQDVMRSRPLRLLSGRRCLRLAGHEVPYYPSFYPQEIRIEPLDADAAAREFRNRTNPLQAYIGASPRFAGDPPPDLKTVESLGSFITASVNPRSPRASDAGSALCGFDPRRIGAAEASGRGGPSLSRHALSRRLHQPRGQGRRTRSRRPRLPVPMVPLLPSGPRAGSRPRRRRRRIRPSGT